MSARRFAWVSGGALAVALALLAATARGSSHASLTLDVAFSASNTIAVTLPDGTPVGTASGAPTVIPAGYYTVLITGPMGLPSGLPYFHLSGPAVDLLSNLNEGGLETYTDHVVLQPSSTYTWTDDAMPGVVWTFATSANVLGTAPGKAASGKTGTAVSQDPIGSDVVPIRGTLAASVSASGKLTVTLRGRRITTLSAGEYRVVVTDRSPTAGLLVAKSGHPARRLSGARYTGKRTATLRLSPGRWSLTDARGATLALAVTPSSS
jgi:hypothetical protein